MMENLEKLLNDEVSDEINTSTIFQSTSTVTSQSQWCSSCHSLVKQMEEKYTKNFVAMKQKIFFTDNIIQMYQDCKKRLEEAESRIQSTTEEYNLVCRDRELVQSQLKSFLSKEEPTMNENKKLQQQIVDLQKTVENLNVQLHAMNESRRIHEETIKILRTEDSGLVFELKKRHKQQVTELREEVAEKILENKKLAKRNKSYRAKVEALRGKRRRRSSRSVSELSQDEAEVNKSYRKRKTKLCKTGMKSNHSDVILDPDLPPMKLADDDISTSEMPSNPSVQKPEIPPVPTFPERVAYITSTGTDESANESATLAKQKRPLAESMTPNASGVSLGISKQKVLKNRMLDIKRKRALDSFKRRATQDQLSDLSAVAERLGQLFSQKVDSITKDNIADEVSCELTKYCTKHHLDGHETLVFRKLLKLHKEKFSDRHFQWLQSTADQNLNGGNPNCEALKFTSEQSSSENDSLEKTNANNLPTKGESSLPKNLTYLEILPQQTRKLSEFQPSDPIAFRANDQQPLTDIIPAMKKTIHQNKEEVDSRPNKSDKYTLQKPELDHSAVDLRQKNTIESSGITKTVKKAASEAMSPASDSVDNAIEPEQGKVEVDDVAQKLLADSTPAKTAIIPELKNTKNACGLVHGRVEQEDFVSQLLNLSDSDDSESLVSVEESTNITSNVHCSVPVAIDPSKGLKASGLSESESKNERPGINNTDDDEDEKSLATLKEPTAITSNIPGSVPVAANPLEASRRAAPETKNAMPNLSNSADQKSLVSGKESRISDTPGTVLVTVHPSENLTASKVTETGMKRKRRSFEKSDVETKPKKPCPLQELPATPEITRRRTRSMCADSDNDPQKDVASPLRRSQRISSREEISSPPQDKKSQYQKSPEKKTTNSRKKRSNAPVSLLQFGFCRTPSSKKYDCTAPMKTVENSKLNIAEKELIKRLKTDIPVPVLDEAVESATEYLSGLLNSPLSSSGDDVLDEDPVPSNILSGAPHHNVSRIFEEMTISLPSSLSPFSEEESFPSQTDNELSATSDRLVMQEDPDSTNGDEIKGRDSISPSTELCTAISFGTTKKELTKPNVKKPLFQADKMRQDLPPLGNGQVIEESGDIPSGKLISESRSEDIPFPSRSTTTDILKPRRFSCEAPEMAVSVPPIKPMLKGTSFDHVQSPLSFPNKDLKKTASLPPHRKEEDIPSHWHSSASVHPVRDSFHVSNASTSKELDSNASMSSGGDIGNKDDNSIQNHPKKEQSNSKEFHDEVDAADDHTEKNTKQSTSLDLNMSDFAFTDESEVSNTGMDFDTAELLEEVVDFHALAPPVSAFDSESDGCFHPDKRSSPKDLTGGFHAVENPDIFGLASGGNDKKDVTKASVAQTEKISASDQALLEPIPLHIAYSDSESYVLILDESDKELNAPNKSDTTVTGTSASSFASLESGNVFTPEKNPQVVVQEFIPSCDEPPGKKSLESADDIDEIILEFIKRKKVDVEIGEEFLTGFLVSTLNHPGQFDLLDIMKQSEYLHITIHHLPDQEKQFLQKMIALHQAGIHGGSFIPDFVLPKLLKILKNFGNSIPPIGTKEHLESDEERKKMKSQLLPITSTSLSLRHTMSVSRILGFLCRAVKSFSVLWAFLNYCLLWNRPNAVTVLIQCLCCWPQALTSHPMIGQSAISLLRIVVTSSKMTLSKKKAKDMLEKINILDRHCKWDALSCGIIPEDDILEDCVLRIKSAQLSPKFAELRAADLNNFQFSVCQVFDDTTTQAIVCLELVLKEYSVKKLIESVIHQKIWPQLHLWAQHIHVHGDVDEGRQVSNYTTTALLEVLTRVICPRAIVQKFLHKNQPTLPFFQPIVETIREMLDNFSKKYVQKAPMLVQCAAASFLIRTCFCNPREIAPTLRKWFEVTMPKGPEKTMNIRKNLLMLSVLSGQSEDTIQDTCRWLDYNSGAKRNAALVPLLWPGASEK